MTTAAITILIVALVIVFCVRNFFLQLVGLKLFLDVLSLIFITMRPSQQASTINQAGAWFISSLGAIVFFILMAAGIRRFSVVKSLDLDEAPSD